MFSIEMFQQGTKHFGLVRAESLTEQLAIKLVYTLQELTGKRVQQITGHAEFLQEWRRCHDTRATVGSSLNVLEGVKEVNLYAPDLKILLEGCFMLPKGIYMVTFRD